MFERFTERARQVVVLAQDEARALKHNYIGTEHILLGLVRENEGVSSRILLHFGVDAEKIRAEVTRMLASPPPAPAPQAPPQSGGGPLRRGFGFVVAFALGVLTGRAARAH